MTKLFSIALFFVLLREALEVSIVVSVLLSFISRSKTNNKEFMQRCARATWLGTAIAFLITVAIGAAVIYIFYTYGSNVMQSHQLVWEAAFGFVSSVFILATGIAFLKVI